LLAGWVFRALDKPWFPAGTLAVNVIGCLVIGFVGGLTEQKHIFQQDARLFLFVGILSGFTTFSAFAYETATLVHDGRLVGAGSTSDCRFFSDCSRFGSAGSPLDSPERLNLFLSIHSH
jgi:protein CrcB